ncbi:hypothetical protein SDC9_162496 [bioreactor metagenome]|uniref:Uncharacterized protein n=1 Tax=bioreactor metagenome TaxID=1076179 RepID=A0A645FL73_9ZZZZ
MLRVGRPGGSVRLLDGPDQMPGGGEQLLVAAAGEGHAALLGGERRPHRLDDTVRPVLELQVRPVVTGPVQADPAEPDRLDAETVEVLQPLGVPPGVLLRPHQPGIVEPQLDVLVRVQHLPLQHQRVAAGRLDPASQPIGPVLARQMGPVRQHLQRAALGEHLAGAAHHPGDQLVGGEVALPVGEPGPGGAGR